MEEDSGTFKILLGKPTGKRPLQGLSINRSTILEFILKKWVSVQGIGLIQLRVRIFGELL